MMPAVGGKRVSWVELYLDLVFVLAVGQLAHVIVADAEKRVVWVALGLFFALWWTWVGFAVLYNRYGSDEPAQRVLLLAASVPAGVAAVAVAPASAGDSTVFALSLAATRLVLAAANGGERATRDMLRVRSGRAYVTSAALFVVSIWIPEPFRYALWAIGISVESGAVLAEDRAAAHRWRHDHDLSALEPGDPAEALDPHHFAERFGLFLIIVLGEVLVEAGQGAGGGGAISTAAWGALVAAMILAAALWWLYFDAAADINREVLERSGGSPTMARAIFAVGHMLPTFALLVTAAGVGLLLEEDPPRRAFWLASIGIAIYLAGTRSATRRLSRAPAAARVALVLVTSQLPRLGLEPYAFLRLLAGWTVLCAALTGAGWRRLQRSRGA